MYTIQMIASDGQSENSVFLNSLRLQLHINYRSITLLSQTPVTCLEAAASGRATKAPKRMDCFTELKSFIFQCHNARCITSGLKSEHMMETL